MVRHANQSNGDGSVRWCHSFGDGHTLRDGVCGGVVVEASPPSAELEIPTTLPVVSEAKAPVVNAFNCILDNAASWADPRLEI